MSSEEVVICSYARTPIGAFCGALSANSAVDLGGAAIAGALARSGVAADHIEQVFMGCVLPAGLGQAPARQAARLGGLGRVSAATTVNKMCGSGMQAVILAHECIAAGSAALVVAGGMESMTNAPYLSTRLRAGARAGHVPLIDSMYRDGLEDADEPGVLMGKFAEDVAQGEGIARETHDRYALQTLDRARIAQRSGAFDRELVPVAAQGVMLTVDEQPGRADPAKIPSLKPSFAADGAITPASSSSISDGAAALVLARASAAQSLDLPIVARIAAHAAVADEPRRFPYLPALAIELALRRARWTAMEVDLYEINEAFAVVVLLAMRQLGIEIDRVNVNGGACALGHPIGASGARILATLLGAMEARAARRGVASICLGGGEAIAVAVERA